MWFMTRGKAMRQAVSAQVLITTPPKASAFEERSKTGFSISSGRPIFWGTNIFRTAAETGKAHT